MSFVDSKEIEALLAEAKATSITEIVSFITDHVARLLVEQVAEVAERVGQLQERIGELERPKGMDRIMIEEVKALVEAMMDQREDSLKRQIDRKYRENICNSFQVQDHSRRSLNELDLNNIINVQSGAQSQQMRRGSTGCSSQLYQKCEIGVIETKEGRLNGEVRQLREDLLCRAERRQVVQVKQALSLLQKEVLGKVTFEEAEKLLMRFQKEVWVRLGETRSWGEELEGKLSKALAAEAQSLKMEIAQLGKSKQTSLKLQRKVKKYLQEMAYVRSDLQRLEKSVSASVTVCKNQHQSQLESLYTQQELVEQFAEKIVQQNRGRGGGSWSAIFMCAPLSFKNGCVAWQREVINADGGVIQWEAGKTNIRVVNAGFYEVGCAVFGGTTKKAPNLTINNDNIGRFDGRGGGQLVPRWYFRQWVNIRQNRSVLSVKFQGEENGSCVLLCLSKML